ncbi:MAG TPA: NADH-quinone oxidoreductase subunit L [Candidatus Acidoferrales bacterium]|nr:NADH-quinone oxidoreductase subunit L [Candidatus Acidoferrales bacterium]
MTPTPYFLDHIWLIPLFPLAGAALMILLGRRLPNSAVSAVCVGSVFVSLFYAAGAVWQLVALDPEHRVFQKILFQWVPAGPMHTSAGSAVNFVADWGFLLDPLSAVMALVVTGVGFLIHLYSIGYMGHEGGYYRFFGYMNLFMFSMLTLVLANNMLLLFVGWEGVGLCSYLLIGFYFLRKSAADAGKKAFIVNRIGDAGFLLGILLTVTTLGTIRFTEIVPALAAGHFAVGASVLTAIALLLFVGATGKSAQLPLYVWLPDAMEGPTPVSALIHAATMVTAGVYMVTRMNAIYQMAPRALEVVAVVGACTAIFAASMGLVQNDIKRVLAYSTISQLGYMFLALGVGAFAAGVFHLMTHAFFKALLFLGSGSVIHALSGEQDMRKMGALWERIPTTARTFFVAALAIAGIPPLAGFFSKDEILGKTFERFPALWIVGFLTAGMTAFYMFRLVNMTFFGKSRVAHDVEHHIHESPRTMTVPLTILAVLSFVGGWIGWPASLGGTNRFGRFLEPVVAARLGERAESAGGQAASMEHLLMLVSVAIAVAGILLARYLYLQRTELPGKLAASWPRLYRLVYRKYYVDEIYDAMFVNRAKDLGTTLGAFDNAIVDGLGVNGAGWLTRVTSRLSIAWDTWIVDGLVNFLARVINLLSYPVRMIQSGLVSGYALLIILGVLIFLGYYGFHIR